MCITYLSLRKQKARLKALCKLKAVTLECMRGAYRQKRQCFLYAFGGPGDVMELDLTLRHGALEKLLAFLAFSFGGGTDVDRPLELSLSRLESNEWKQVMYCT